MPYYPPPVAGAVGANPTALVGLTAVNGVAVTYMRSDAAPTIDVTAAWPFGGLAATVISQQGASASALTLTGGTVTTSQPLINGTQTWNAGAVAFTGIKLNVTSTASAAASAYLDLQLAGASKIKFSPNGIGTGFGSMVVAPGTNNVFNFDAGAGYFSFSVQGVSQAIGIGSGSIFTTGTVTLGTDAAPFAGAFIGTGGNTAKLTSPAAATLQLGAANSATPVNQTVQAQGSRAGTDSNVGGANATVQSGLGTGTGARSTLTLRSPVVVASGTGAQTQTAGLVIDGGTAVSTGYTVATLPATPLTGARAHVTDALAPTFLATVVGGGAITTPVFYNGANWVGG